MAETLRELVVALSLDSSTFSRNMRYPQPADQGSRVHLPAARSFSLAKSFLEAMDGFFVLAKLKEGKRGSVPSTGRKRCPGGKDAHRFKV